MIGTRVTARSQTANTLRGLETNLNRAQKLQNQLSSGRQVEKASDDPAAAVSSMKLRSQRRADEQYLRNIDDARGRLSLADDALTSVSAQIRRAQELMTSARDAAMSPDSRAAMSAELTEIRKSVIDTYNVRWIDRPVFAGTSPGQYAIDPSSGSFVGNDQPINARISRDVTLRVDASGTASGAADLPALLAKAADDVVNDVDGVAADEDAMAGVLSQVLKSLGDVGARAAQLDTTQQSVDKERLDFTARISENEDVDLPYAIMNLQSAQASYQASLGAAAKVMQTSLLDFLR